MCAPLCSKNPKVNLSQVSKVLNRLVITLSLVSQLYLILDHFFLKLWNIFFVTFHLFQSKSDIYRICLHLGFLFKLSILSMHHHGVSQHRE